MSGATKSYADPVVRTGKREGSLSNRSPDPGHQNAELVTSSGGAGAAAAAGHYYHSKKMQNGKSVEKFARARRPRRPPRRAWHLLWSGKEATDFTRCCARLCRVL